MGKTILITGATSGIGKATAIVLAKNGHKVYATGHTDAGVAEMKDFLKGQNLSIESFKLDITSDGDRKKIADYKIDVLINNAGIGESGSLSEVPMDRLMNNFETNVFGTMAITQEAFKQMVPRDSGKIIIISSLAGRRPSAFLGPYSMSKFALSAAADILKQEMKYISKNIHISVVEPGPFHTGYNQKMMAKKYEWMGPSSYFWKVVDKIRSMEAKLFKETEYKSLDPIVRKIVKAAEANNSRLRYVAPWWEGAIVQVMRIFGK